MKSSMVFVSAITVIAAAVVAVAAMNGKNRKDAPVAWDDPELIEHGRYMVFASGLCIDCHSPRNERGEHIEAEHLMGSPIGFSPLMPMPWAPSAPRLAGLPAGYTEEQLVEFMMTGARPNGLPPALPPMPPYRLNRHDAEAVAAFLRAYHGPTEL
jgi:cytochrome c553